MGISFVCVTTDILTEYKEIITKHMGASIAHVTLQLIENAPNTIFITRYYKWNLITQDPDDNKFVDCAISSDAKFLVSEDKHFNILKKINFPKVELIDTKTFLQILSSGK